MTTLKELQNQNTSEHVEEWIQKNKAIFLKPTEQELLCLSKIFEVRNFQNMVGTKQRVSGSPVADPFLVAAAMATEGCVVTEEMAKPNSAKIPSVCKHFGIDCTNLQGMMERERWRF